MEENRLVLATSWTGFLNPGQRWVLADVLGDAGGVSDRRCYLMAHNTGRRGGLRKRASAACEEQLTVFLVFLREEEVGTF